jgi:hypothetical protein
MNAIGANSNDWDKHFKLMADIDLSGFTGTDFNIIGIDGDIETSGHSTSAGGTGKTTAEMQTASTYLQAGWDFVDETEDGSDNIWWILEGQDYPRLWWELISAN